MEINKIIKLFIIIFINCVLQICSEDLYENDPDICNRCNCEKINSYQILKMDCINKNIKNSLSNWPPHNQTIIATFSYNNITTLNTFPTSNSNLQIIYSHCNIKYLSTGLFENTKNIEFVDFSYNLLTAEELSSDKFKGPYNNTQFEPIALKHLNLAYNQIHSLNKNLFNHLPNLKILNLEGNHFTVLDIQTQFALASIQKLEILNLANNQLTELIDNAISNYTNLIELNLEKNNLDFVPECLYHVGNSLEKLILDNNPIIKIIDNTFLGLRSLIELSLNNLTELKYINANSFTPMINLKKLSINNALVLTTIDREAFGINQTLEEFYLNNNNLNHLDYKLLKWSNLKIFQFKNNPFDCTCDLFNLTKELINNIKESQNGPYCLDIKTGKSLFVYNLTNSICNNKYYFRKDSKRIEHNFTILRLAMIIFSILLMLSTCFAIFLSYTRFKKVQRNRNYPFATQVTYNPLSTTPRF